MGHALHPRPHLPHHRSGRPRPPPPDGKRRTHETCRSTSRPHQEHCRACHCHAPTLHLACSSKSSRVVDTLASDGPFTVFAPTNDAFAKVPKDALNSLLADKEALTAVLLRHVVPGAALTAQDVPVGSTDVKTAGGEEITVTRDKYIKVKSSAGGAGVVAFDVLATNGVVHLVDTVF